MRKLLLASIVVLSLTLQGCANNPKFWEAFGRGLSRMAEREEQQRQQEYETMKNSLQVIPSGGAAYKLEKDGYIYPANQSGVHVIK